MHTLFKMLALITSIFFVSPVQYLNAQNRVENWSTGGFWPDLAATNCSDCEEDIDVLIRCNGRSKNVELVLYVLAWDGGEKIENLDVSFTFNQRKIVLPSVTVNFGLVGNTPVVSLPITSPILSSLQTANEVGLSTSIQNANVGLKGSYRALAAFKDQCSDIIRDVGIPTYTTAMQEPEGFSNSSLTPHICSKSRFGPGRSLNICLYLSYLKKYDPAKLRIHLERVVANKLADDDSATAGTYRPSQTVLSHTPPIANSNGLFWFTGNGFGGGSLKALSYAIPESDGAVLVANCGKESSQKVDIEIYGSDVDLKHDKAAAVSLMFENETSRFEGFYFSENEEYSGVRFSAGRSNSLWQNVSQSKRMKIIVDNLELAELDLGSGRAAIAEFTKACSVNL